MSSIKKSSEFEYPILRTRIEVERQDGLKREDLDVKSFDDGNKKENNEDVSMARLCRLLNFTNFEKSLCARIKKLA
ncbi:unnamed protein product [Brugia pahangi]|uniref:Uncharacterized protein n=1 Tax=Brugia pahangi TaxID=6280 RepID=A0A0N4T7C0_BRUPA|nr:unnamed protein product [Brugia pahangi]